MTAAFSPGESWVLIGACLAAALILYGAIVGRPRRDRRGAVGLFQFPPENPPNAGVRVRPTVYDWYANDDFDDWERYP